jgi:hypothetical protein
METGVFLGFSHVYHLHALFPYFYLFYNLLFSALLKYSQIGSDSFILYVELLVVEGGSLKVKNTEWSGMRYLN